MSKRESSGGGESAGKKLKPATPFSTDHPPESCDDVVSWACLLGIPDEAAQKLKHHHIDGIHLRKLSKFNKIDCTTFLLNCGISGAAAIDIAEALAELFVAPPAPPPPGVVALDKYGPGFKVKATVLNERHQSYKFECEFMIDWGCLIGPCYIPLRKVQQMNLEKLAKTKTLKSRGVCQFYSPIRIEMTDDQGKIHSAVMEPFVSPEGAKLDSRLAPAHLVGLAPPGAATIPISPVKIPIPKERDDLDTPLLGPAAFDLLELGFDSKKKCLYALEQDYV